VRQAAQVLDSDDDTFGRAAFALQISNENTDSSEQLIGLCGTLFCTGVRTANIIFQFIGHLISGGFAYQSRVLWAQRPFAEGQTATGTLFDVAGFSQVNTSAYVAGLQLISVSSLVSSTTTNGTVN
jgi:hypothetical protein